MAQQITLHLDDIQYLFNTPEFDLFAAHPRQLSGIDSIFEELTLKTLRDRLKTIIFVPTEQFTPDLTNQVRQAISLYAEQQIRALDHELSSLRRRSIRSLQMGLIFLGVCLLIAALADEAAFLPHWLSSFLNNGFTIIGWVSLWLSRRSTPV